MQIDIDPQSPIPLYQQLHDRIIEALAAGRLATGEQLASVRQVAGTFGINVATVSKGYDLLREEGLIRTNRKSGSVVVRGPDSGAAPAPVIDEWLVGLRTVLAHGVVQGIDDARIIHSAEEILRDFSQGRRRARETQEGTHA